jgi:hypothetical protein
MPLPSTTNGVGEASVGRPSSFIARRSSNPSVEESLSHEHMDVLNVPVVSRVISEVSVESKRERGINRIPPLPLVPSTSVPIHAADSIDSNLASGNVDPTEAFNSDTEWRIGDPSPMAEDSEPSSGPDAWGNFPSDSDDDPAGESDGDSGLGPCVPCAPGKRLAKGISKPMGITRMFNSIEVDMLNLECKHDGDTDHDSDFADMPEMVDT